MYHMIMTTLTATLATVAVPSQMVELAALLFPVILVGTVLFFVWAVLVSVHLVMLTMVAALFLLHRVTTAVWSLLKRVYGRFQSHKPSVSASGSIVSLFALLC